MGFSDRIAAMDAAVFTQLGAEAVWTPADGSPALEGVWVILQEGDQVAGFGRSRALVAARVLEVRRSDVAGPAGGDRVAFEGRAFELLADADPRLSDDGAVWSCEAREL